MEAAKARDQRSEGSQHLVVSIMKPKYFLRKYTLELSVTVTLAWISLVHPAIGQTNVLREIRDEGGAVSTVTQLGMENAQEFFLHLYQRPQNEKGKPNSAGKEFKLVFDRKSGLEMRYILIRYVNLDFAYQRGRLKNNEQRAIGQIGEGTFTFLAPDLMVCSKGKISANFDRSATTGAVVPGAVMSNKDVVVLAGTEVYALYNLMEQFDPVARELGLADSGK